MKHFFLKQQQLFEIQRGQDGNEWKAIGQVADSAESRSVVQYHFRCGSVWRWEPLPLKMVDQNETFAYSRIRNLRFESLIRGTLFPNPVGDNYFAFFNKLTAIRYGISKVIAGI